MKRAVLKVFIAFMNLCYRVIRLFVKPRHQVTLVSRQSDRESIDFRLLREALQRKDPELVVVVLPKMLKKERAVGYFFHMFRQMGAFARSRFVVTDTYCILLSVLHHRESLRKMQIWHAIAAVKQFGWQTVGRRDGASETVAEVMQMHRGYDWFACASRATAAFFAEGFGQDLSRAVLLGLPRIDYITKEDPERLRALREAYPQIQNGKKNVLYVPTIRKHAAIDLWPLIDAVDPERYNLIVKLHPLDRAAAGTIRESHVIMDSRFNSYDWLEAADIVVSDYSAFVLESTLRERPLYLYTYDLEEYRRTTGINMEYEKEAIGKYQFRDAGEMVKAFEEPYDFRALRAFREKYIEVPLHGAADRMADFILEKIREQEKQD